MLIATDIRTAMLAVIEAIVGTDPDLYIFDGVAPASITDPDAGTVLAIVDCPTDWLDAASGGQIDKLGTWSDPTADNTGTAAYWRLKTSGGTTKFQGSCSVVAGGGEMELSTVSVVAGDPVTVNTWTLIAPGA